MRTIKIVADSAADVLSLNNVDFAYAPLKIITDQREFVDDEYLDVEEMVRYFSAQKMHSKTACPAPGDWLEAFGEADDVFCVTITSGLSGSYNSACVAKDMYEADHPGRRVYVLDSLSAGAEMTLLVRKLEEYVSAGMEAEAIDEAIRAYAKQTGLLFILESLKNLAANGRVSSVVAKLAGVLGIRVVGRASAEGQLEPLHKCRGGVNALKTLLEELKKAGLSKGRVQISHCQNPDTAQKLKEMIQVDLPEVAVSVSSLRGLCSYYAEQGGLLIGFEKI